MVLLAPDNGGHLHSMDQMASSRENTPDSHADFLGSRRSSCNERR